MREIDRCANRSANRRGSIDAENGSHQQSEQAVRGLIQAFTTNKEGQVLMLNTPSLRIMLANEMVNYNRRNMETYVLNRRNELLGGVLKNVESFEAVEKRITSDRFMSDEGKRAKLAEEATKALASFKGFGVKIKEVEDHLSQLRNKLFVIARPKRDETLQFLREQEIRGHYVDMTQPERDGAFMHAAEQDRDETLLALLDAPIGPMVSEEVKDRAFEARAKRVFPADYKTYEQNTMLLEVLNAMRNGVAQWMRWLAVAEATVVETLQLDPEERLLASDVEIGRLSPAQFVAARS